MLSHLATLHATPTLLLFSGEATGSFPKRLIWRDWVRLWLCLLAGSPDLELALSMPEQLQGNLATQTPVFSCPWLWPDCWHLLID